MRVLVVDDLPDVLEEITREIVSRSPLGDEVLEVVPISDYREVLAPEWTQSFEFLITDMRMGAQGFEGLAVIEHAGRRADVVIVLTAYASIPNCVQAMRAGAWDYIEKSPDDGDPYERLLDSMAAGYEHRSEHPQRGQPNPDDAWVQQNLGQLMLDYPGEVVAVLYESVIDHDPSFARVSARVKKQHPLSQATFVAIPDAQAEEEAI